MYIDIKVYRYTQCMDARQAKVPLQRIIFTIYCVHIKEAAGGKINVVCFRMEVVCVGSCLQERHLTPMYSRIQ